MGELLDWTLHIDRPPEPAGNVNFDDSVDADDIDLLFANLGSRDATYDLDNDGDTDQGDVDELVLNLIGSRHGDVDLDHDVDDVDFSSVATNYDPIGDHPNNGWAKGDSDGDQDIDITDLFSLVTHYAPLSFGGLVATNGDAPVPLLHFASLVATPQRDPGSSQNRVMSPRVATSQDEDCHSRSRTATVARTDAMQAEPSLVHSISAGTAAHDSRNENVVYDRSWNDLARRCRDRVLADHISWLR